MVAEFMNDVDSAEEVGSMEEPDSTERVDTGFMEDGRV